MEKIFALVLHVIHFNTEDIIVTSSLSNIHGLDSGQQYFALGTEMSEARPDDEIKNNDKYFYKFQYDALSDKYSYNNNYFRLSEINSDAGYYAWYNNGWKTENQNYTYYSNGYTH